MKAKDLLTKNKPPMILLYGPPGGGKTALISQLSKGYLIDTDDGMRTALTLQDRFTPLRQAIEFDTIIDTDPLNPAAFLGIKNKLLSIRTQVAAGKWPYNALIIDTLTGLARSIQLHTMKCSKHGNALAKPTLNSYGDMNNELESILTIMRSIPILKVVTAHEMAIELDNNSIIIRIMSTTKPHGMNKLPWLFDEVLYVHSRQLGQGKLGYMTTGRSSSTIMTRTRSSIHSDINTGEIGMVGLLEKVGYKYEQ